MRSRENLPNVTRARCAMRAAARVRVRVRACVRVYVTPPSKKIGPPKNNEALIFF